MAVNGPSDAVIEIRALAKDYRRGEQVVRALADVDFVVERGEYVAIMGPSGSGKSTLLNVLGCLDAPTRGVYRLGGRDVAGLGEAALARVRSEEIGFVFQSFHLLPRASAQANVELPLVYRGVGARERRRRARVALERVGLADRRDHRPGELSGGQCQRVAIARALVAEPRIVLADEPTGNLDSTSSAEILDLIDEIHRQGNTIILVTHDEHVAGRASRVVCFRDGRITSDARRNGMRSREGDADERAGDDAGAGECATSADPS